MEHRFLRQEGEPPKTLFLLRAQLERPKGLFLLQPLLALSKQRVFPHQIRILHLLEILFQAFQPPFNHAQVTQNEFQIQFGDIPFRKARDFSVGQRLLVKGPNHVHQYIQVAEVWRPDLRGGGSFAKGG